VGTGNQLSGPFFTSTMSTSAVYTPSSTPLRTKRNFKSLKLPDDPIVPPPLSIDPVASRPAPAPGPKKRPPPLGGEAATNSFILDPAIPAESPATGRRSAMHATISRTLAKFDFKQLDLKNDDLRKLADLGQGNGGSVVKVEHVPTGTLMAKKVGRFLRYRYTC
jgi:mitogen-activated protein kinase kinase